jgi:hypothetical protein
VLLLLPLLPWMLPMGVPLDRLVLGREFRIYSGTSRGCAGTEYQEFRGILAEFRIRLVQRSLERQRGSKYHMVLPKYALIPANSGAYVIPAKSAGRIRNLEFLPEFFRNSQPRAGPTIGIAGILLLGVGGQGPPPEGLAGLPCRGLVWVESQHTVLLCSCGAGCTRPWCRGRQSAGPQLWVSRSRCCWDASWAFGQICGERPCGGSPP